ncbi:multicopper oxidase domain-containing protein, partial [Geobacter sp. OR-1]|uniref:multicopper oxidase domain-containing protein n=1 Tax=Geobacter sp. OR-1 TaxID=1266765 RepID=UPI0006949226
MKKYSHSIIVPIFLFVLACMAGYTATADAAPPVSAFTPPGLGSVNPALQPDGIQVPDVFGATSNWQFSPPLRKFVTSLAPLGCTSPNEIGQCIPVAVPDKMTFSGSDYYEIELRRYTEKMHPDLPNNTTLQGYVQVNNGTNQAGNANNVAPAPIHYLGPVIVAQKDRPVRIKFVNKLPLESVEPFFLPVDTTVMGSGMGPKYANGTDCDPVKDPRNPDPALRNLNPGCAYYPQNRAELHLHGGLSPWISDGTPHQWVTPLNEVTPFPKADNVQYVPDMWFDGSGNVVPACAGLNACPGASNNPGPGAVTYYYTNQQSARLMFYHDHSYGITRLNVYAGEAAGYLIQDPIETALVNGGTVNGRVYAAGTIPADQIPLVIQDKTFVDATQIETLDPTWVWGTGAKSVTWHDASGADITATCTDATCSNVPGARKRINAVPKTGDLWWPHVYMPAENPSDLGGVNPMGRWVYGMFFWPPTTGIKFLPVANPYYDCGIGGLCDSPWEPPTMPASPNPSWVAEAFVDTMMVNGTVFPKLSVQPKAYRLRILNASHDRFVNLQLYKADATVDPNAVNPLCNGTCAAKTEVKMVPAVVYPGYPDWDAAADSRVGGVPDPTTSGPKWIQIGNEGGFLPKPVVINNKPISFVLDPTLFNVGNVNDGTVILGPAERADVIIDFSQYAGQTLILYNDAPAAFPAFVPTNDYYTGAPDLTAVGGHPGPKAGMGPNTRTIMQINVANVAPAAVFNETVLQDAFKTTATPGVFQASQEPVIVGQTAYDSAYNTTFPSVAPNWGLAKISDNNLSFETIADNATGTKELVLGYPMEPKAIHDEMGAVWDEYGRMSAKLGVELPNTNNINQIFVMQNYQDPPTELVQDGKTQLWKITHNGVDTHPIHFHLFDVQVVNRVGWDGFIRLPWENELGWKETVRVSPLEDTIVALRPRAPKPPFALPDSLRLLQPAIPAATTGLPGAADGFMNLDPLTGQAKIPADTNNLFNFGAEYVWHCHILSHEEQDMMRSMIFRTATAPPADPTGLSVIAAAQKNTLSWADNSYKVVNPPYNTTLGFIIERCNGNAAACAAGPFTQLGRMTMLSNGTPTYDDTTVVSGATYTYRVTGYNRYIDNAAWALTGSVVWYDGLSAVPATADVVSAAWSGATDVTLDPYFPTPHAAPVKFYALGVGGTGSYQYRFSFDGAMVQDYSATRFWEIPAGTPLGAHSVTVDVRTDFASAVPDTTRTIPYDIRLDPPTNLTLVYDKPNPQAPGTVVNFTATATGSSNYEYRFLLDGVEKQAYGPANVWAMPADTPAGTYAVTAEVRTSSLVASDLVQVVSFTLDPAAALTPPGAPTIGTAYVGNASAVVTFSAPANIGGSPITGYTVTSSPGGVTATGKASPISVTGLTNVVAYKFTVTATNAFGTGPASAASNSVLLSAIVTPTVTISAKPANPTNLTSGQVAFSGTNAFAFQCQLDSNPIEQCVSPYQFAGLADAAHTFTVKSVNAKGQVSTPATWTWTVDTTPPDTAIGTKPATFTGLTTATF